MPNALPCLRLPAGTILHRVHDLEVACDAFIAADSDPRDPRRGGRFDPLPQRTPVAVLYAASSADAALGETLVHVDPRGVLHASGMDDAPCRALSRLRLVRSLRLVAFCGLDVHRFPVRNRDLVESGARDYPRTRAWALAFRRRARGAHGIAWVSRQDNTALSFVFWRDRLRERDLEPVGRPLRLGSRHGARRVREVLARMGAPGPASPPRRARR